jgi:hypothetical protein
MTTWARGAAATVAGLLTAVAVVSVVEFVSGVIYPVPRDVRPHDGESIRRYVESMPSGVYLSELAAWGIGVFGGSWVATRLVGGSSRVPGFAVGAFLLVVGTVNLSLLPRPDWFAILGILVFPLGTVTGIRLASRRRA